LGWRFEGSGVWCGEVVLYVRSLGGVGWSEGEEGVKSRLRGRGAGLDMGRLGSGVSVFCFS